MDTLHNPSYLSTIRMLERCRIGSFFPLVLTLIFPLSCLADTFPDSPFNGMQITYSISGAQVTETSDVGGFTTSRALKGTLTSPGTLSVSGTVGMGGGYYADATVSVSAGGKTESWSAQVETGFPGMNTKSFSVSVPVPEGTETGSISIRMTGYYNAGTRGLVVSGGFTIPVPDGIKQAPDQAGGRGDNPQTAFYPDCSKTREGQTGLPSYSVNTSLLNLVIDDMDFGCQSYDHDQALRRIWSMNPDQFGMFGRGWAFAYDSRILAKPYKTGGAKVTFGTGQVIDYEVAKSEDGGLGIIFVDYSRTSKGLGAELSAQLDDTSGTGVYYLSDKRTKQTYVYKFIKQVSGSNLYLLESLLDRNGNAMQLTYDDKDRLSTITDVSGRKTVFSYDSNNRCTRMDTFDGRTATYQYDYRGNLTQSTDLAGNVISYSYDYNNYMTSMTVVGKTTQFAYATKVNEDRYISTVTEPDGQIWRYKLNKDGSTQITEPGGGVTTYANSSGRTTLVRNALNQSITKEFNDQFLPVKVTDSLGRITSMNYDSHGNLIRFTDSGGRSFSFTYDDHWNVTQVTNALGQITEYSYDGNDNLIAEKSPGGSITRYEVDAKGQVIRVTRPDGTSNQMRYDAHGNLIGMTDPLGHVTEFGFDSYGLNPSTLRDALGNTTGYSFDANRRLTTINQANGNRIQYNRDCCSLTSVQDGAGRISQYERDEVYRLTKTTDPLGQANLFTYNADGDLTGATDALSHTSQIAYDAIHQPSVLTDPMGGTVQLSRDTVGNVTAVTDERGKVTTMTYDNRNLLSGIKDPLGKSVSYTRDALGRISGITNARGETIGLVYDVDGRLLRKQYNGADVAGYVWDANDQLTAVIDASGTKTFTRDAAGRVTRITYPDGKTIGFVYDANGNRTAVTYPDGLTATYTYDSLNRVASVSFAGNTLNLNYDAAGNLIGETRSNGVNSSYGFDAANQLIRVNHQRAGAVIADITYIRNAAGLITQESGTWPLSPSHPFEDANATHNDANAIITWNSDAYTHDADGNLIGISGSRSFVAQYDPENRPTNMTRSGNSTQYAYDALGNRISQQSSRQSLRYYHDDSGLLLSDLDASTNVITHHIYADGRLIASGSSARGGFGFYHADKTGNTLALTGSTGEVVGAYAYDAYGKVIKRSGPVNTPFTYVGAYGVLEEEDNIFFMRNRYYDAIMGRFIQRDPIGFSGGEVNKYLYVNNQPITLIDPHGKVTLAEAAVGSLIIYIFTQGITFQSNDNFIKIDNKKQADAVTKGIFIWLGKHVGTLSEARQAATMVHERVHVRQFLKFWMWTQHLDQEIAAQSAERDFLESVKSKYPCDASIQDRIDEINKNFADNYSRLRKDYVNQSWLPPTGRPKANAKSLGIVPIYRPEDMIYDG